jgi:hypothetical protein
MRFLVLAYGELAVLALVARWLPAMHAATLALAIVALALLPTAGFWHRGAVRRIERLHRFAPDRWLGRWAARRVLGQVVDAVIALALASAALLQSPFFGPLEWALLAAAPLAFAAVRAIALLRARRLFSRDLYAASTADGVARIVTFALACAVWLVARCLLAASETKPLAEVAYQLQLAWPTVVTATARWAIDAGAWGQAIVATLDSALVTWWRAAIAVAFLPLTVFGHAVWSASGAMVDVAGWRRMLGTPLTDADRPAPLARPRLALYGACALAAIAAAVVSIARTDAVLARQPRLLALEAVPQCERIGSRMYSLGTLAKVAAFTTVLEEGMRSRRTSACARIAEVRRLAERNVDAYLDWYFSLGGDWTRTALMLAGDADALLEAKFNRLVAADPQVQALIGELAHDQHYLLEVAALGRNGLSDLLEQQRLVLD